MNKLLKILFVFSMIVLSNKGYAAYDSLRIETRDGQKYIVHKVEPKETLYSLGKRYHVSVAEITRHNEEELDGYSIDQVGRILYIPYDPKQFNSKEKVTNRKVHVVEAGETLYSLSKRYGISQDKLMEINGLENATLSIGQELKVEVEDEVQNNEALANVSTKSGDQSTHVVDLGETIYSISKQYGVSQEDLMKWNNLESATISAGQKLLVKSPEKDSDVDASIKEETPERVKAKKGENYRIIADRYDLKERNLKKWNSFKEPFYGGEMISLIPRGVEKPVVSEQSKSDKRSKSIVHTVESGETLYSLSTKYEVNVDDLRNWNNLTNYSISTGQKLYIADPDSFADVKVESSTNPDQDSEEEFTEEKVRQEIVENIKAPKDTKAIFTASEDEYEEVKKVTEKGIAELIEGSENTEKYLALHRTAKIGTIMQVKNELNDQLIFVRVLGKIPDTGVDKKVVIKISKKAFEKLGGVDYKFPVEISYLPLKE